MQVIVIFFVNLVITDGTALGLIEATTSGLLEVDDDGVGVGLAGGVSFADGEGEAYTKLEEVNWEAR